ncbi:hypothetical protein ACHAXS_000242, partial [Conticribra weissflogii]
RTRRLSDHYAVRGVVLASGGLAGIYRHSTNLAGFNALGSSVGLALRLHGALLSSIMLDLEYVQFHPTALYLPNEPRFLLAEALCSEGAILRNATRQAFAREYHPRRELALQDVIACAVFCETQLNDGRVDPDHAGGGVVTNLDRRMVDANDGTKRYYCHLYAACEAARTGLHGGNRLASTSLLGGLVFGSSAGEVAVGMGMGIGGGAENGEDKAEETGH